MNDFVKQYANLRINISTNMSNNNKQSECHSNTYKKADKEFYDKLRKEIEES